MRRKIKAVKLRRSTSIPTSLPQDHIDGKDTGSHQDKDNNKDVVYVDDDDDGGGDNVVAVDSVPEVDRHAGGNPSAGPSGDCKFVDWLEGEFCIRCNGGSGRVLVCSENGCPVGIHEACMNCEPKFDDTGKFYCPYCWFKQELARTKELRKKAMLAKEELSNFICVRRDGKNEEKLADETVNVKGASVSTMAEKGECENGLKLNDDGKETIHRNQDERQGVESISKEKPDDESIPRTNGFGNGERIEEDSIENSGDSEDDEIDEDRWQIRPSSSSHLGIVEGTLHVPTKETCDVVGALEENQGKRGKEETVLPNAEGTTTVLPNAEGTTMALISQGPLFKVPAIESFEFLSPDLDNETIVGRSKRVKRTAHRAGALSSYSPKNPCFQPSTSAKNTKMNQEGKTIIAKNSVRCQEPTKQLTIPTVGTEKRRRLHWTAEEEDMLKEGVRRFSTEVNKNIPWRKILEYGHHVFHTTRTPVDLKDKWKNMMAKK